MNAIQPTATSSNRKHSSFIDMTPLVDLGFLLITFFIFTSSLSANKALKLNMPNPHGISDVKQSHVVTLVLGKDHKVYYYEGFLKDALKANAVRQTIFGSTGVRELLMMKKDKIGQAITVLVRPSEDCTYADIVNSMDEIMITNVEKWVLMDPDKPEYQVLKEM